MDKAKEEIVFYEGMELPEHLKNLPKGAMTRGQQTAWIVGAILAVGLVALYFAMRLPEGHIYYHCQIAFGLMDKQCMALAAANSFLPGN
jgi:hypothetical protein